VANAASLPSVRYFGRFGRKRFTFRTTTSMHLFAREAAKRMLAFIVTRDRLSATKTELLLAFLAREGSLAIKAESPQILFTGERIFAVETEALVAHFAVVELVTVVA
jgi:hypothetical protein